MLKKADKPSELYEPGTYIVEVTYRTKEPSWGSYEAWEPAFNEFISFDLNRDEANDRAGRGERVEEEGAVTLQELEHKKSALLRELDAVRAQIFDLKCEAIGVRLGDVVIDQTGAKYKVCQIDHCGVGTAWLIGHPQNKNGAWSRARRCIGTKWKRLAEGNTASGGPGQSRTADQ